MPCSNCSRNGHNIRTCLNERYNLVSDDSDINELDIKLSAEPTSFNNQLPQVIECMVCYEDIKDEKVNLKCGHAYCVQCFIKHMRVGNNCAGCRAPICDPPTKTATRTLSHSDISDLIDSNLGSNPNFIGTIHSDMVSQANKYIDENYGDTTEVERRKILLMMKQAIESTDLTFGFWLSGFSMVQNIIDAVHSV